MRGIRSFSCLLFALASATSANSAEIKVFTTRSVMTILDKVGPEFERSTGHMLNVTSDIAINLVRRIEAGEPFDFSSPRPVKWIG